MSLTQDLKILICSVKNVKSSQKRTYRTFYVSNKHERLQKIESFLNIMTSKGFYFSSKIEKNKGDRDFNVNDIDALLLFPKNNYIKCKPYIFLKFYHCWRCLPFPCFSLNLDSSLAPC